jgi:hypothetical protein
MGSNWDSIRREFWMATFLQYVGAANSREKEGATRWADYGLKMFDERFHNSAAIEIVEQD